MAVRTFRSVCKDPNWVITSILSSAGRFWKDMIIKGVCSSVWCSVGRKQVDLEKSWSLGLYTHDSRIPHTDTDTWYTTIIICIHLTVSETRRNAVVIQEKKAV